MMKTPPPKDSPSTPDPSDRPSAEMIVIRELIRELRVFAADLRASSEKNHARAEEDRKRAEADLAQLREKLGKEVKNREGLRGSLSRGIEDSFAASLKPLMAGYGIPLDDVRVRVRNDNSGPEFDILGLNGTTAVVGEVKIQLKRKDVGEFATDLRHFREYFPEHARDTVYGVVAGMTIDDDAASLARQEGFFILQLDGAVISPQTPKGFRPQAY